MQGGDAFAKMARQILVIEKQRSVRDVALALGMQYATFYARLNGRVPFRPEEITRLLREVPDPRLADCLLANTEFLAVRQLPGRGVEDARHAVAVAIRSAEETLQAVRILNEAIAHSHPDPAIRGKVEEHVVEARRGLAALQLALPQLSFTRKLEVLRSAAAQSGTGSSRAL
jgi:hypothetical protein